MTFMMYLPAGVIALLCVVSTAVRGRNNRFVDL